MYSSRGLKRALLHSFPLKALAELFSTFVFELRAEFWSALKHPRTRHPPSLVGNFPSFRTRRPAPRSVAWFARWRLFPFHFYAAKKSGNLHYLFYRSSAWLVGQITGRVNPPTLSALLPCQAGLLPLKMHSFGLLRRSGRFKCAKNREKGPKAQKWGPRGQPEQIGPGQSEPIRGSEALERSRNNSREREMHRNRAK